MSPRAGITRVMLLCMKTAVSIPDDLFRLAEAAARRMQISRSQFYARAISELLNRHQESAVTDRLNEFYSRHGAKVDKAFHRAQLRSLEKDSW
jgi:metal-responsive CopG/Arc/MetJ family transcriptional regulator